MNKQIRAIGRQEICPLCGRALSVYTIPPEQQLLSIFCTCTKKICRDCGLTYTGSECHHGIDPNRITPSQ